MTDANAKERRKTIQTSRRIRVTPDDMLEQLPAERRARAEARATELIAEEMSMRDLRKPPGKMQVAIARKLGLKRPPVTLAGFAALQAADADKAGRAESNSS